MWNGAGHPGASGTDIALPARLMHVASTAVLFGPADADAAATEVGRRAGTYLDPDLAEVFRERAHPLMAGIGDDAYRQLLDCEPDPVGLVDDAGLEGTARVFGDLVDLKSPRLHGHSRAVATTASDAARRAGLGDADARTVLLAGHLHDLGRVAVPSRVWDKVAALSASEQDQAALHPYHSERILDRIPSLAAVAVLAGQHHERCDGTGYHRGLSAPQLSMASRLLAAADAYQCLLEDRPGQPGVTGEQAADRLAADGRRGRLDAQAVSAVLTAVGHGHHAPGPHPGPLTSRQVEVLRLMAAGLSNPEIARRLVISRRTAEHHVQDVYQRIGSSTRAGAALYAMEHGLLGRSG
jgi:HD-GYP domain-containing protein (c-di-GMP phosphodiesterase class II)